MINAAREVRAFEGVYSLLLEYSHCSGRACGPGTNTGDIRIFAFDSGAFYRSALFGFDSPLLLFFLFLLTSLFLFALLKSWPRFLRH